MKVQYFTFIKAALLSLIAVTLPFALVEQFIYMEVKSTPNRLTLGVLGISLSLIETVLVFLALGRTLHVLKGNPIEFNPYLKKYLRDLVIETFRAMGRVAVGFLLIVPGIIRATQYYLIPFIVQFDEKYQKGEIEVLEEAKTLLRGRFLRFFGVLCLTQIFMFGIQIGAINYSLFVAPLEWALLYIVELVLQAAVFLYFYNYYKKLKAL